MRHDLHYTIQVRAVQGGDNIVGSEIVGSGAGRMTGQYTRKQGRQLHGSEALGRDRQGRQHKGESKQGRLWIMDEWGL